MFVVRIYRKEHGGKVGVGKLEFFGVPVGRTNGSSLVEVDTAEWQCRVQVRLTPPCVATTSELQNIADALCRDETTGRAGRYEWEMAGEHG